MPEETIPALAGFATGKDGSKGQLTKLKQTRFPA